MPGKSKSRKIRVNRKPKVSVNVKKYVKNVLKRNAETVIPAYSAPADIQASTTGDVVLLTNENVGDGQKVKLNSIHLRGRINSTSTNTDSIRMMLVRTKTQLAPTWATMFKNPSTYAIQAEDRKKDFEVLFDRRYNIDIVQRKQHFFDIKKYVNKTIKHEQDDAGAQVSGDVYLMVLGSLTAASTNGAVIKYDQVISYKDF